MRRKKLTDEEAEKLGRSILTDSILASFYDRMRQRELEKQKIASDCIVISPESPKEPNEPKSPVISSHASPLAESTNEIPLAIPQSEEMSPTESDSSSPESSFSFSSFSSESMSSSPERPHEIVKATLTSMTPTKQKHLPNQENRTRQKVNFNELISCFIVLNIDFNFYFITF
jgi:hypothetical protein